MQLFVLLLREHAQFMIPVRSGIDDRAFAFLSSKRPSSLIVAGAANDTDLHRLLKLLSFVWVTRVVWKDDRRQRECVRPAEYAWVERPRVHPNPMEALSLELDSAVRLEAFANHPPEGDARQAVASLVGY